MSRHPCPVCGDPSAFPFWIGDEPPDFCPYDDRHHETGERSIFSVTECSYAMGKARQRAEFRKALPEAFDEAGNMKKDRLGDVLAAWSEKYPGQKIYL